MNTPSRPRALHTLYTTLAVAGGLLAAQAAWAGPTQASITPPGGFGAACGSQISAGATYIPGRDFVNILTFYGQFDCQSQEYAGPAGSALASANWTSATVQNAATVQAGMGAISMTAQNRGPLNVQFPIGIAGGGWSDVMTIDLPGRTGESAVWLVRVNVNGSLSTAVNGLATLELNAYKNTVELSRFVAGFDKGGSDGQVTDNQRLKWSASTSAQRTVADSVVFAVPVVLGQSFEWGVYATNYAAYRSYGGSTAIATATTDFTNGVLFGGTVALMQGDTPLSGYALNAVSGIDWRSATAVPEPSSAWMLALGLGWFAWSALGWRRRDHGLSRAPG